jgi:hypothetical protein
MLVGISNLLFVLNVVVAGDDSGGDGVGRVSVEKHLILIPT